MAFTGTAVIKKISENKFSITGLSLAGAAVGTISLLEGTGEVKLVAEEWRPYKTTGRQGEMIDLSEGVSVQVVSADAAAVAAVGAQNPSIVKTGTTRAAFLITMTNKNTAGVASGLLDIQVRYQ